MMKTNKRILAAVLGLALAAGMTLVPRQQALAAQAPATVDLVAMIGASPATVKAVFPDAQEAYFQRSAIMPDELVLDTDGDGQKDVEFYHARSRTATTMIILHQGAAGFTVSGVSCGGTYAQTVQALKKAGWKEDGLDIVMGDPVLKKDGRLLTLRSSGKSVLDETVCRMELSWK